MPLAPALPLPISNSLNSTTSVVEPPLDFSSPAQFTPCLDTSAARHRMSVKPRNQRASTKKRLAAVSDHTNHSLKTYSTHHTAFNFLTCFFFICFSQTDSRSYPLTQNNVNNPELVKEEEQPTGAQDAVTLETEREHADIQILSHLPSKCTGMAPVTSESLTSQHDIVPPRTVSSVPSEVLRVKLRRPVDVKERPHSSFIESELKNKREGEFDIQLISHDKRNALIKTEDSSNQPSTTFGSLVALRSSSFHQQVLGEIESTRGIKRSAQGSGSFHYSISSTKTRDGERPRSGSFVGALGQPEAKAIERTEKPFSSMKEKEELKDLQLRGGGLAMGRHRQEGAPPKSSVLPWERRDTSKKTEPVTISNNVTTDTGSVAVEEVDSSQEVVEEAVEVQEVQKEGKTHMFGVKLRPTSQSVRLRSDASSSRHSKPPVCEEQGDQQKRQEISDTVTCTSKTLPTNISNPPSNAENIQLTGEFISISLQRNNCLRCTLLLATV